MKVEVKVKNHADLVLPQYMTPLSAGFDLVATGLRAVYKGTKEIDLSVFSRAIEEGYFILRPQERALVGTGLFIELPEGKEMQIRPRSGLALKRGITVLNSPGTIDGDYRGEICIILLNTTAYLARINFGDAIAQGVVTGVDQAEWNIVSELSDTARGAGGFGHTSEKKESKTWLPEHSGEINVLTQDTFLSDNQIPAGTYVVTGKVALAFPKIYSLLTRVPYDGRRLNRVTVYSNKSIKIEYLK